MFIKILWDDGDRYQEAVVTEFDAAFSLCWALDKAPNACVWWTLPDYNENAIVWYKKNNGWEKVKW